jgi:hypothetical protein
MYEAYRKAFGQDLKPANWGFADDSIELLSVDMYVEFVLPFHKRLIEQLAGDGPHSIHLCGNVERLMPTAAGLLCIYYSSRRRALSGRMGPAHRRTDLHLFPECDGGEVYG